VGGAPTPAANTSNGRRCTVDFDFGSAPTASANMQEHIGANSPPAGNTDPSMAPREDVTIATWAFSETNMNNTSEMLAFFNNPHFATYMDDEDNMIRMFVESRKRLLRGLTVNIGQACDFLIEQAGQAAYDWSALRTHPVITQWRTKIVDLAMFLAISREDRNKVAKVLLERINALDRDVTHVINATGWFNPIAINNIDDITYILVHNPVYDKVFSDKAGTLVNLLTNGGNAPPQHTAFIHRSFR
jgi:hypothetical protein